MIMKMLCAIVCLLGMSVASGNDWTRVLKAAITSEGKLEFYGKVVDQDGQPVKEIRVLYETSSAGFPRPIYRKGYVKTDTNGLFVIKGGRIGILYIEGMEKPGYEIQKLPPSFDYRQDYRYRHKPDKEKPVEFLVRRKDHAGSFLLRGGFYIELSEKSDGDWGAKDFGTPMDGIPKCRTSSEFFWDIEATGEVDKEKGVWNVTFKTNGENSGIQCRDNLLYEAPEDGYTKNLFLSIPFGRQKSKPDKDIGESELLIRFFYARLRKPGMYARLDVEKIFADETQLTIYCHAKINPYGDRSLEELTFMLQKLSYSEENNANAKLRTKIDKSIQLKDNCEKTARQAMREQRFAERPPFDEWMKEGLVFW